MPVPIVVLVFAVVAAGFASTWRSLFVAWTDFYSHGFLVAPYGFWLAWSRRHEVPSPARPWFAIVGVALVLSLGWLLGRIALLQIVHQTMLPLILASWALAVFGRGARPVVAAAAVMLLLAVPLLTAFVPLLQSVTVSANAALLAVSGLKAEITGTFIRIPEGLFEVADGCAGSAFFAAGISLAAMYVSLMRTSRQAAVVVVLSAVVLSLVTNWLRVFGLILVGHWTNMQHPLINDHGWYGWVIFAAVQPLWLWISAKAEKRWPHAPHEIGGESPLSGVDWRVVAGASLACLTGPALALALQARPRAAAPATLPDLAAISLSDAPALVQPGQWTPSAIAGQQHLQAIVRNGPTAVQVDRVIFSNQQQGAELVGTDRHLGDSVEVLTDEVTAFSTTPVRLVRQAIVRYKGGVRLVWYWYRVAGVGTTQSMKAKLLEIPAGIIGSSPSEFVAVSTPCGPRDCADAARALRAVLTRP